MQLIFLDRDGVINKYPGHKNYVTKLSEFRFLPDVKKTIAKLTKKGFKIFVISNQAGVSKGLYSKITLNRITTHMLVKISDAGGEINGVYYCLHQDKHNCSCRKPKAGLIYEALKHNKISRLTLARSYFIGDTIRDVLTAKEAGVKSILVFSGQEKQKNKGNWQVLPDYTAKNLSQAAELILKQ